MPADEFEVIKSLFAPLATHSGARGLADDVAEVGPLIVTTDAIVEGVHFLPQDPIATVAMKAVRVNVSDLIAKGALPRAALLTLIWPQTRDAEEIALFAEALKGEFEHFGVSLLGGDTTSTPGPLTISITAFGEPLGRTPSRADAQAGEDVWLAGGEIGSAWLGLQLRSGAMSMDELARGRDEDNAKAESQAVETQMPDYLRLPGGAFDVEAAWLMSTYLAPFLRVDVAHVVSRFARASMDVSDGLVADAGKMAAASGVALRIEANALPFSVPAARWVQSGGDFRKLITGGDDYVVLFTAPPEARAELEKAEQDLRLGLTRIGAVEAGAGVSVVDREGVAVPLDEVGYAHRLGR